MGKREELEHTLCLVGKELVNLGDGSVEGNDIGSVIGSIENQVLTHDGQADEAEISSGSIVSIGFSTRVRARSRRVVVLISRRSAPPSCSCRAANVDGSNASAGGCRKENVNQGNVSVQKSSSSGRCRILRIACMVVLWEQRQQATTRTNGGVIWLRGKKVNSTHVGPLMMARGSWRLRCWYEGTCVGESRNCTGSCP